MQVHSKTILMCQHTYSDMIIISVVNRGLARTQFPTNINYALEFPTFGEIAGVNQLRGAMEQPRPGGTTYMIMVYPRAR